MTTNEMARLVKSDIRKALRIRSFISLPSQIKRFGNEKMARQYIKGWIDLGLAVRVNRSPTHPVSGARVIRSQVAVIKKNGNGNGRG